MKNWWTGSWSEGHQKAEVNYQPLFSNLKNDISLYWDNNSDWLACSCSWSYMIEANNKNCSLYLVELLNQNFKWKNPKGIFYSCSWHLVWGCSITPLFWSHFDWKQWKALSNLNIFKHSRLDCECFGHVCSQLLSPREGEQKSVK